MKLKTESRRTHYHDDTTSEPRLCQNSITGPEAAATGLEHSTGNIIRYVIHAQAVVEFSIQSLPLAVLY